MADGSKEEIAHCFAGADLTDENTYEHIRECMEKQYAVASQYQGTVSCHMDQLKIKYDLTLDPKRFIYEGERIKKLYVCHTVIPAEITSNNHTQEGLIKYRFVTAKIHKRWYILFAYNEKEIEEVPAAIR